MTKYLGGGVFEVSRRVLQILFLTLDAIFSLFHCFMVVLRSCQAPFGNIAGMVLEICLNIQIFA